MKRFWKFLKNKKLILFYIISTIIASYLSCQKPIEPNIETKPKVTILVRDRATYHPIDGAWIYIRKVGDDTKQSLQGTTSQFGEFKVDLDIPCSGAYFYLEVQPPKGTCYETNKPFIMDSLLLFCCDSTIVIPFTCEYSLRCDKAINLNKELKVEFCLDTSLKSNNISEVFSNSSNKKLSVSANTQIPNFVKIQLKGNFQGTPINLLSGTTKFNLDVSQNFFIDCKVELTQPVVIDTSFIINFEGRDDLDSLCFLANIKISLKTFWCSKCNCPKADTIEYKFSEMLCLGESLTKTYPFTSNPKNIKNQTTLCKYIFVLTKDFTNQSILNISSISGSSKSSFEIEPGQSLSQKNININYKIPLNPKQLVYIDSAIYQMYIINEFGKQSKCNVILKIVDTIYINRLFLEIYLIKDSTKICENQTTTFNLCIENNSRCNFDTTITLILSGPDKDKFNIPFTIINGLKAWSKECIPISFYANPLYIWDISGNCRVSLGKSKFSINITLQSQSSFFNNRRYKIEIEVDTTCFGASPCFMEFDSNRTSRQEALVLSNIGGDITKQIIKLKKDLSDSTEIKNSIYVTQFFPFKNPTRCTFYAFVSDVKFKLIRSGINMPNEQTLCTYICKDVTSQCNDINWQNSITVNEGDLIGIKLKNKCAYLVVTKIFYDSVYDVHRICVAVCTETPF